jgi:hypothetical protein
MKDKDCPWKLSLGKNNIYKICRPKDPPLKEPIASMNMKFGKTYLTT